MQQQAYNFYWHTTQNGDFLRITDALGNIIQTEYNALNKVSATIDVLF